MAIESVNPATDEVLKTFDPYSARQVDEALGQAHAAFKEWRETSFAQRAELVLRAAAVLRQNKERFGELIVLEMGKPIVEAVAEIEKCAWNCEFYAENAQRFLTDEHIPSTGLDSYVAYEPLGVVLAVMPWNYPFWQVIRFAAPALMAGNGAVLKHASNVPQCALAVEEVFRDAGFPRGLFRTVLVPGSGVEPIIADRRIRAVTLTGSDLAGEQVAAAAGRHLKKTVMELGGSDPFIVLADADLRSSAETAARARFQNSGQSCIAAKRFIVEESVVNEWEELFKAAVAAMKVGDGMDPSTRIGPLARADLVDALERQVVESVAAGAKVVLGGKRMNRRGYFFEPTILSGVTDEMVAFREETFGPVAPVIRAKSAEHAVEMANDSDFGLGGAIWTGDLDKGQTLARRVESGAVFVNGMTASDPRLPFGGVKRSGYGRELSAVGIREFVNIQTIWVGAAVAAPVAAPVAATAAAAVASE
ncbi:MAG: NAD-dependent succinate-semialdehyde dehydrogenase [Chloroflexi bacterium]|nr:NAD-dependent succinate-semialdehyde dehydrogenase [Chloroflexota bacterium]